MEGPPAQASAVVAGPAVVEEPVVAGGAFPLDVDAPEGKQTDHSKAECGNNYVNHHVRDM